MTDRYAKSFLLSLFLYSVLILIIFIATKNFKKESCDNTISISVLSEIKPKESKVSAPSPELKNELKEKKYTDKKKEAQNNTLEKHSIIKSNDQSAQNKNPAINNRQSKTKNQDEQPSLSSDSIKNNFLAQVKNAIQNNKQYPKDAKDREIEGKIFAEYTINKDGSVSNIIIASGNNLLKGATRKAIEKSFPITIPSRLIDNMPTTQNITLNYFITKE